MKIGKLCNAAAVENEVNKCRETEMYWSYNESRNDSAKTNGDGPGALSGRVFIPSGPITRLTMTITGRTNHEGSQMIAILNTVRCACGLHWLDMYWSCIIIYLIRVDR